MLIGYGVCFGVLWVLCWENGCGNWIVKMLRDIKGFYGC